MSLWDWAVRSYAAPGVAPALLGLQDDEGQSVCLLLWAAWTAASGCEASPAALAEAAAVARDWEAAAVGPLRAARRGLKNLPGGAGLRAQVQEVELAAERALLQALEAVATTPAEGAGDTAGALAAAAAAWGRPAPPQALADLAAAFPAA